MAFERCSYINVTNVPIGTNKLVKKNKNNSESTLSVENSFGKEFIHENAIQYEQTFFSMKMCHVLVLTKTERIRRIKQKGGGREREKKERER